VGGITDRPVEPEARTAHWDSVYGRNQADRVSWFEPEAVVSMELVDVLGIEVDAAVIDVGGGASVLVDALLGRGFTDLTVLDIADAALRTSRDRVGPDAPVTWFVHDLLTWEGSRSAGTASGTTGPCSTFCPVPRSTPMVTSSAGRSHPGGR